MHDRIWRFVFILPVMCALWVATSAAQTSESKDEFYAVISKALDDPRIAGLLNSEEKELVKTRAYAAYKKNGMIGALAEVRTLVKQATISRLGRIENATSEAWLDVGYALRKLIEHYAQLGKGRKCIAALNGQTARDEGTKDLVRNLMKSFIALIRSDSTDRQDFQSVSHRALLYHIALKMRQSSDVTQDDFKLMTQLNSNLSGAEMRRLCTVALFMIDTIIEEDRKIAASMLQAMFRGE